MQKISTKQQKVFDFICNHNKLKGYPPSVRDICEAFGLKSTSTAHGYLSRLEKRGFIKRNPMLPRAIQITKNHLQQDAFITLPLVGSVKAGIPAHAEENIEDYIQLPTNFIGCREDEAFILRVSGDSMINAGIFDGDNIIVQKDMNVYNGDIVVALMEDKATVKRFYKEEGRVRLQPENDSMKPIYTKDLIILGKVVGLMRRY